MFARTAEKRFGALGRMGLVAAIHVAALFVIARSLGIGTIAVEPKPLDTEFIDEARVIPPEEALPGPALEDFNVPIPRPDDVEVEEDRPPPPPDVIGGTVRPPGDEGGSAVPRPEIHGVRVDARHPLTQPPYPMARIRNSDEGSVDLEVYVLPNGRVGDARVLKTSGFEDFDRAALQEAKRSWRLTPATRDGQPFAQWYALRVVFKLKNQE
jgi:periplasmic protein TonB